MAKVSSMEELFLDELRDLYDAEKQLTKALPKMARKCTSEQLREALEEHLEVTEGQMQRLEQIFEAMGQKSSGKKCVAMSGLVKEGEEIAKETEESTVRDAGLIAAAQKVEHYEISGYGSARTHAQMLGNEQAARLLEETLEEEKEADAKLNEIAESMINEQAMSESSTDQASMGQASGGRSNSRSSRSRSHTAKTRSAGSSTSSKSH